MAQRQENVPVYIERTLVLGANAIHTFNVTCDRVNLIEVSGALSIAINEGDESTCRGGIGFGAPGGLKITRLTFKETAGAAANVTFAISNGEIQDNRASFAGDVSIKNAAAPNDSVQVDLLAADPGLVALAAAIANGTTLANLLAGLREDTLLRAPLTTLDGASYAYDGTGGSETTIVAAGANTSGIIIRMAQIYKDNSGLPAYIKAGGNIICGSDGGGGTTRVGNFDRISNVFIPAGNALVIRCDTQGTGFVWYEVL